MAHPVAIFSCPAVAATVDDPVAVETAQPWGQRDSIMPRSKGDDAARKREERSVKRREREDATQAQAAAKQNAQGVVQPVAAQEKAAKKAEDTAARVKVLRAQTRIHDFKGNFHDSLSKQSCAHGRESHHNGS